MERFRRPKVRRSAVVHQGNVIVETITLLMKEKAVRAWEISTPNYKTVNSLNAHDAWLDLPYTDEGEKGSPMVVFTDDINSLDAESYTTVILGLPDVKGWDFALQIMNSRTRVVAYKVSKKTQRKLAKLNK